MLPNSKHYVVLLVDTENITHGPQVKDFCSFPGLGFHPPEDSIKNYTTDVLRGDSVIWLGVSTSDPDLHNVSIEKIISQGSNSVLDPPGYAKGKLVNSEKRKLGFFMGDNSQTGIQVSIMHGRTIGPNSGVSPGIILQEDVPPGTIVYKKEIVERKEFL